MKLFLTLALVLPALSSAALITTTYNASLGTLPQAQGFTAQMAGSVHPAVSNGILDVDAFGGADSAAAYYSGSNGVFLYSSFVMEASLRIVNSTQRSSPGSGSFPRGGFQLFSSDNNGKALMVHFSETGLWLATSDSVAENPPSSGFFQFDTTDSFHTYRVEVAGTAASLFIDGSETAALSLAVSSFQSSGAPSSVDFGDSSGLTRSHYQLRYFLYSSDLEASAVPEPGTFALLGLALAGLAVPARRFVFRGKVK